jgi:hypothetical protein
MLSIFNNLKYNVKFNQIYKSIIITRMKSTRKAAFQVWAQERSSS